MVNLSHGNRQAVGTVRCVCLRAASMVGTDLLSLVGQPSFGTSAVQSADHLILGRNLRLALFYGRQTVESLKSS